MMEGMVIHSFGRTKVGGAFKAMRDKLIEEIDQ